MIEHGSFTTVYKYAIFRGFVKKIVKKKMILHSNHVS